MVSLEESTPWQRYQAGYLTQAEATALARAAEMQRRDALGIPTYDPTTIDPSNPTAVKATVAYSPQLAAENVIRTESMMGTPGSAMYEFMSKEVAAGVPASIALQGWQAGHSMQGSQGGAQSQWYGNINALQNAGITGYKSYASVADTEVQNPTESQLKQTQDLVSQIKIASAVKGEVSPYIGNAYAASSTPEELADVRKEQQKHVDAIVEGYASRLGGDKAAAQKAFETQVALGSLKPFYALQAEIKESQGDQSAADIYSQMQKVTSMGGTIDPNLALKAQQEEYQRATAAQEVPTLKEIIAEAEKQLKAQQQQSEQAQSRQSAAGGESSASGTSGSTTAQSAAAQGELYMSESSTPSKKKAGTTESAGDVLGLFGSKRNLHRAKPINKRFVSNDYGSGFMAVLNDINKKVQKTPTQRRAAVAKTTPQKTTIKPIYSNILGSFGSPTTTKMVPKRKEKEVETWAHFALENKKVTNTKKPATKLVTQQKVKKEEFASAWEQILFSKKPKKVRK